MRIALIYPPPWKIPAPGQRPDPVDGPPPESPNTRLDPDFLLPPWGLLSIQAQVIRAGYQTAPLNLVDCPWVQVEKIIRNLEAEMFGLSCFTGNRRGAALLARLIREVHPRAHIVIGGPHVTALARETLEHYPAIDTVVIGEGEETFLELIRCLETGREPKGLPGTAWREGSQIHFGPPRPRIRNLDALASPLDYFSTNVILTSRGCPGRCTFCASPSIWGRRVYFHSVDYVLDMLEKAVRRDGCRIIGFKDDTFTVNRRRALAICQGIRDKKLNFIWSCDTRADVLDEELLKAMREAGCQRISLGVESASPVVLKNIKKDTSPEQVREATRLAKKFGFQIRYYMMAGNRGETWKTFRESLEFLESAKPHDYVFSLLNILPGTEEFRLLEQKGLITSEVFFTNDFLSLTGCADAGPEDRAAVLGWLRRHGGLRSHWDYGPGELKDVLARLPRLAAAHLDLGGAYFRTGELDRARHHLGRALELDYPLPGHIYNYLALIAAARADLEGIKTNLDLAARFSRHQVIQANLSALEAWMQAGGPAGGRPLELKAYHRSF